MTNNTKFNFIYDIVKSRMDKKLKVLNATNDHKRATVDMPLTVKEIALQNAIMLIKLLEKDVQEALIPVGMELPNFCKPSLKKLSARLKRHQKEKYMEAYPKFYFENFDQVEIDIMTHLVENCNVELTTTLMTAYAHNLTDEHYAKEIEGSSG